MIRKTFKLFGLLILAGMGAYIYSIIDQAADVDAVCLHFPKGTPVGDLKTFEERYSVKLMGPFEVKDQPGTHRATFCATLTMCDTSCTIEYRNNVVIESAVSNL